MTKHIAQKGAGKSATIIVIMILAVSVGIYLLTRPTNAPAQNNQILTQNPAKSFTIAAKPFSFTPSEIRVSKGDTVKITLQNQEGTHDWVLDEFNARTERIGAGATATVEFVADKTGTFEYYCSVANHRAMGMKGNLIVE